MDFSLLGFTAVRQMFNAHPVFVHFPIALLPASLLLYFLGVVLKNRALLVAGRACLYMAMAGGVAALATGFIAGDSIPHNETIHSLMQTHKAVALAFLGFTGLLSLWSFIHNDQKPKGAWAFLAGLVAAMVLLMLLADLGGRMVYLEGAGVKPAVPAITGTREKEESIPMEEPSNHHNNQGEHEHQH